MTRVYMRHSCEDTSEYYKGTNAQEPSAKKTYPTGRGGVRTREKEREKARERERTRKKESERDRQMQKSHQQKRQMGWLRLVGSLKL